MNKIVIAIDSFKGCLTSMEANRAAAEGVRRVHPNAEIVQVPVSDGGEGFIEAFHAAIGGELVEVTVRDPLMRPITAKYLLKDKTAVIEMAQASGLTLLTKEERNPLVATSYGTGQLVADAIRQGASHIIVGLGGSATCDAGMGMLRALVDSFAKHGTWDDIEVPGLGRMPNQVLKGIRFTIASDVKNPLYANNTSNRLTVDNTSNRLTVDNTSNRLTVNNTSNRLTVDNGAAHVFAPQKGATPADVLILDKRLRKFAEISARHFGYDRSQVEGAGAAGGLGYAFLQYMDADCKPGIQLLLETIKFDEMVKDADLVITGEGSADRQTLMGKLPTGILEQSGTAPVYLIAGRVSDGEALLKAGFARVACINPTGIPLEEAMRKEVAIQNISRTVSRLTC